MKKSLKIAIAATVLLSAAAPAQYGTNDWGAGGRSNTNMGAHVGLCTSSPPMPFSQAWARYWVPCFEI